MSDAIHAAATAVEAGIYVSLQSCPHCGRGPLVAAEPDKGSSGADAPIIQIAGACLHCRDLSLWPFQIISKIKPEDTAEPLVINPTPFPSRIIDVGQWLTLARMWEESANGVDSPRGKRNQLLRVGQCLDEALKFYDEEENDLPPTTGVFHSTSIQRLRDHPEQFSRRRLVNWRRRLPHGS